MTQRFEIIVTRYEQETATNEYGPYLTGRNVVASVQTTHCADRAALLRELDAHGAGPDERRAADGFVYTHGRYRREWRVVPAAVEPVAVEPVTAPEPTVQIALTPRPLTIEYALVEIIDGQAPKPLPHCGSWYSDRYAQNTDLMGREAAEAAAQRVADHAGGEYRVVEVRRFRRTIG